MKVRNEVTIVASWCIFGGLWVFLIPDIMFKKDDLFLQVILCAIHFSSVIHLWAMYVTSAAAGSEQKSNGRCDKYCTRLLRDKKYIVANPCMMARQKTVHAPLSLLLRICAPNVSIIYIYMYIPLLQELPFSTINCQSSRLWQKQVRWRSGGNEHGDTFDRLEYSTRRRHHTTGITRIEHNSHRLNWFHNTNM